MTGAAAHDVFLSHVLDTAREAIASAREQGIAPSGLMVSRQCLGDVREARAAEERLGMAPQLLGLELFASDELETDEVVLRFPADDAPPRS